MNADQAGVSERELYDATYYGHHCGGVAYERSEHWLNFFAGVAARIVTDLAPGTVLDVGCAHGFLVEALRARGVDARGIDISHYAIEQVHPDVRPYCSVGNILEPLSGRYDLVTCIEVLEHLDEEHAATAVANLTSVSDDIVFTSSPVDFREETHVNVRPPEYWVGHFARNGFFRDVEFDGSFLTWWAMRFRRSSDPAYRVVVDYEREIWRLKQENRERHQVVLEQMGKINELEASLAMTPDLESENSRLREEVADAQAEVASLSQHLGTLTSSGSWQLTNRLQRWARFLGPLRPVLSRAARGATQKRDLARIAGRQTQSDGSVDDPSRRIDA